MIRIRNVLTPEGKRVDHEIKSSHNREVDGSHLVLFPGLIDPHVHFRTPGLEDKEDWRAAAKAAIAGGITTVFDMPNTLPACITKDLMIEKKELIDRQLKEVGIPLRYRLYLGADKANFDQIEKASSLMIGLKIFMGSSTGNLVMDDESSLHAAFSLAAAHDIIVAVHAEDEQLIESRKHAFQGALTPQAHSQIRNHEVALRATEKAIALSKLYQTRLYLAHISTKEEMKVIEQAKKEGVPIFAEVTPHHLFLDETYYETYGTKVQMNPPIRTREDCEALWQAIHNGIVDTIGSDHAPHTLMEKNQPYGKAPSGIPGVETTLPLLLNAYHEKKISLEQIVRLMKKRPEEIFRLSPNEDVVLIDLNLEKKVDRLFTKCGWSPYEGRLLKGWPIMTIINGEIYDLT